MNTPNEEPTTVQNSAYNPFPEPQTIPSGWDLSGMLASPQVEPADGEAEPSESLDKKVYR